MKYIQRMATTKLRIFEKKKNEEGKCVIYVQYVHNEKPTRFSTGEKIAPEHWDASNSKVKASYGRGYVTLNDSLLAEKEKIERLARFAKISEIEPTGDYIKNKIQEEKNKGKAPKDFIAYYKEYLKNNTFQTNTQKGKTTTLNHLKDFAEKKRMKLTFDSFTHDFYLNFLRYLEGLQLQQSSIGKHIKNLKAALNYYFDLGINQTTAYKKYKKPDNDTDIIVFTAKELERLKTQELTLKNLPPLRDLLILGCNTGLRFSDLQNLKMANINLDMKQIKLTTIKTRDQLSIPLNEDAILIIKKYANEKGFLPKISNQKFNELIKDIGKLAKINDPTPITTFKKGQRDDKTPPKYTLITSHIMRRTFITQNLLNRMQAEQIMKITGHKDYHSFHKYIKFCDMDVSESFYKANK
jgi:integrase